MSRSEQVSLESSGSKADKKGNSDTKPASNGDPQRPSKKRGATSTTPRILTTVNDYSVLPLAIPPTRSFPRPATHYLYIRPNAPKVPTATTPRELFLVNIPLDTTHSHLRHLFAAHLGGYRISSIAFDTTASAPPPSTAPTRKRKRSSTTASTAGQTPLPITWDRPLHPSGSSCTVTFVDELSATSALAAVRAASKARTALPWGDSVPASVAPLGLARYKAHHSLRYPDAAVLQENVDSYMAAFNAAEEHRAREEARKRAEPDADGFVTVTRGGRGRTANEGEAREMLERQRGKMGGREDFYRFQVREKRREEALRLRKGFEEERRSVVERRGKRRLE